MGWRLVLNISDRAPRPISDHKEDLPIRNTLYNIKASSFALRWESFHLNIPMIFSPAVAVGIISGIYGIGGGAILAPFLVTGLHIPVYAMAGAVLFANFVTSLAGMRIYSTIPLSGGATAPPDWLLGVLFGIGGLAGMYSGARWQIRVPQKVIKSLLAAIVTIVAGKYILQYFL